MSSLMAYYDGMAVVPAKLLESLRDLGLPQRELALLLVALGLGLLLMPLLVWVAGTIALGPYANGGFGALLGDFLRGLADGSLACWLVLAGPYLLLWLWRGLQLTLQRLP
jgi:hypothetical protein